MSDVRSYRDLIVWQKLMALARRIYQHTCSLPREEIYGLTSQMRRAAVSIAANIAEGHARATTGEFRQFIGIARGSLAELETLLRLAADLSYSDPCATDQLLHDCDEISRLQAGLLRSLGKGPRSHGCRG